MGLNLAEIITAAKNGYKPSDIIELSTMTDKYNKEDILTLVSSGFSLDDLKKTVDIADSHKDTSGQDKPHDENKADENKGQKSADTSENKHDDTDDSIDYKTLYELYKHEKKLREDLQHENATGDASGNEPKKTDEEIAIEIANDILH